MTAPKTTVIPNTIANDACKDNIPKPGNILRTNGGQEASLTHDGFDIIVRKGIIADRLNISAKLLETISMRRIDS